MKPVICTIARAHEDESIEKILGNEIKSKTFRDVIEIMIDPDSDGTNPGYTAVDARISGPLKSNYEKSLHGPVIFCLAYISTEDKELEVGLDEKLSSKKDLFHEKKDQGAFPEPYDLMQLVYSTGNFGGNE